MSCSRYQFELSQCLDGRLTSARRREVMAHTDTCPRCSVAWVEMQEAQSLIFRLDQPTVSTSFRNRVWDRVESGEGTPEVLLNGPITMGTKFRYGLFGAAAAALLLVTYNLLFAPAAPSNTQESLAENKADNSTIGGSDTAKPEPAILADTSDRARVVDQNHRPPVNPGFVTQRLTAATLVNHTVNQMSHAATRLKLRRGAVLTNPADTPGEVWTDIRNDVQVLGDSLQFLGSLERADFVEFRGRSRQCMEQARFALETPSTDRRSVQILVRTLGACPLDGLSNGLRFYARATEFNERLVRVIQQERERIERMFSNLQLMPPDLPQVYGQRMSPPIQFIVLRQGRADLQTLEAVNRTGLNVKLFTGPARTTTESGPKSDPRRLQKRQSRSK